MCCNLRDSQDERSHRASEVRGAGLTWAEDGEEGTHSGQRWGQHRLKVGGESEIGGEGKRENSHVCTGHAHGMCTPGRAS